MQKRTNREPRHEYQLSNLRTRAEEYARHTFSRQETSRYIGLVLRVVQMSPKQFAGALGVAPQTVNRWLRGSVSPQGEQFLKIIALIDNETGHRTITDQSSGNEKPAPRKEQPNPRSNVIASEAATVRVSLDEINHQKGISPSLGVHLTASIMALEMKARNVWIIKCGSLREAARGFFGESVLQALKDGTHFHYLFLADSLAEKSFRSGLQPWLAKETFSGSVTGYVLQDPVDASRIGLGRGPGAWIVIEYSQAQVSQMQRSFDVFFALSVREYLDSSHHQVKNEDGQPCWLELATAQAAAFQDRLNDLIQGERNIPTDRLGRITLWQIKQQNSVNSSAASRDR